jgi:hypothetical protein
MPSRLQTVLLSTLVVAVLALIGVWAFGQGLQDWRYQLAGLADPFLGRPAPVLSIIAGLLLSGLITGAVLAVRRRGRPMESSSHRVDRAVGWWWVLAAGWSGYVLGGASVIAQGGPVDYAGRVRLEFGAPLNAVTNVAASCRSVVGQPGLIAEVTPAVDGVHRIDLRSVAIGRPRAAGDVIPPDASLMNDGVPGNDFAPPNVPDRPPAHLEVRLDDGTTRNEPALTFVRAYDYQVERFLETGLSGEVELLGTRFEAPAADSSVRWVDLTLPNDPWPETYRLTVSWTCDRASGGG